MNELNIKGFITDNDIKKLQELLKLNQNIENWDFRVYHNESATPIDTLEIQANVRDAVPRLRINIRNNRLRLIELFLLVEDKGTGSKIIDYLIEIAKRNKLDQFEIYNVQHDNIDYKAYNLGMKQEGTHKNGNYSYNYILDLK